MKTIVTLAMALGLSACDYSTVTPMHIKQANALCAPNSGLVSISDALTFHAHADKILYEAHIVCVNGAVFELKREE